MQIEEATRTYGRHLPLVRLTAVYGGVPIEPQTTALRGGVEILVATPGRLLDHVGQRNVNLGQVEVLVLDEADRMLDMGFLPDIRRILELLPARRQNLLFSATFSDDIRRLSGSLLRDPARVEVAPRNTTAEGGPPDRLSRRSRPQGAAAGASHPRGRPAPGARLHAHQDRRSPAGLAGSTATASRPRPSTATARQPERTRALEAFKRGDVIVLVATDVASRGLDIEDLPHVVNFELPFVPEDYIHRIGRTARAGAEGDAISLVCVDEVDLLRGIQRLLKRAIPWKVEDGFIPDRNAEVHPIHPRTQTGGSNGSARGARSAVGSGSGSRGRSRGRSGR